MEVLGLGVDDTAADVAALAKLRRAEAQILTPEQRRAVEEEATAGVAAVRQKQLAAFYAMVEALPGEWLSQIVREVIGKVAGSPMIDGQVVSRAFGATDEAENVAIQHRGARANRLAASDQAAMRAAQVRRDHPRVFGQE